jgi:hypothetical protein
LIHGVLAFWLMLDLGTRSSQHGKSSLLFFSGGYIFNGFHYDIFIHVYNVF